MSKKRNFELFCAIALLFAEDIRLAFPHRKKGAR